ncbi:MAG: serine/threonine-protein kinase [Gammaproteobacteria bacterium]
MTERFELLSQIGKGGMGVVWKCLDSQSGQLVALKLLHTIYSDEPEYIARFEREIEVAQRIRSPYVVRVLGYGEREGVPYMAMEYVDGVSLAELIRERHTLPWDDAKRIVTDIARGLAATHAAGVIHRDVKPSNVLIDPQGRAKLADFGIARAADLTRLTGSAATLGTPAYMSPEGRYSVQSDLYSLGCVLFEMLAGAKLFEGDSMQQIIVRHIGESPDLTSVDGRAVPILSWLLEKQPSARPNDCEELLAVLSGQSAAPQRARFELPSLQRARPLPTEPKCRKGRKLVLGGVSAVVVLVSVAAFGTLLLFPRSEKAVAAPEWGIDTSVQTAFAPAAGVAQAEMTIGPVVYSADRLIVSFGAKPRCTPGQETMKWIADVGTSNVSVVTPAGAVLAENGWGLGNQDAVLTCDIDYVGTWVFKLETPGSEATSLRYSGPEFEIPLPGRNSTPKTTNEKLQLTSKLRTDEQLTVSSSRCLVSLVAPAKGATSGPCFTRRDRVRVRLGPVDNLQRWFEVTADDGAHGWVDQEVVGVSLSP